jgi:hypothetical protein
VRRALALAALLAAPLALTTSHTTRRGFFLAPDAASDTVSQATTARRAASPSDQIDVSQTPLTQAEVAVAVDEQEPSVLVAGSNSATGSSLVYGSTDGGATWLARALPSPSGLCSYGDPALAIDALHRQYYAFLVGGCVLVGTPQISLALATRASADAAWTSRVLRVPGATSFNDKEAIAVDTSPASPHVGRLYLAWSRLASGGVPLQIVVSHSDDGGLTWSRAVRVNDGSGSDATYPGLAVGADGTLYVTWFTRGQRVLLDRSVDGGDRFGTDVSVVLAIELPHGLCHFGGTALAAQPRRCIVIAPAVSVDRTSGRVYVTYGAAGRSGLEQNVYVSAYDGATLAPLLERRQINPPDGAVVSDQFFAASAVDDSTGRLWACWYDTTGDPTRKGVRYSCAASGDGGATWTPPVRAATVFSNETVRGASPFEYGDYAGLAVAGGVAHPMWTDSRDLATLGEEIYTTALQLP